MANLKAGTTIGGKLVWSASNLPLTPKIDTIEYMGHKIYSTHDKPTLLELDAASLAYTNTELGKKVDKVAGKALSDENFTLDYKNKLIGIAAGAQVNVPTNLSYTTDTVKGTLNSTTGNSVAIDGVTITKAGLISSVDKVKLDSLPSGNNGIIPITGGGTGSNTQAGARTALQLGNHVTHNYGTAINTVMQGNDARVLAAATNADLVSGLALKADKTITLTAGTGLSGGGDLTANRTFSVNYGTAAGTAAQGNDSRINNGQAAFVRLNIGATAATARTALELGNHVTHNYGTTNNSVMQGNDARVLAAATKTELTDGLAIAQTNLTNGLATKAAASHTHPWAQVTGQPATATRWPTFAEVTGKPDTYATTWAQVTGQPATATRWPTFAEVTGKPDTFAAATHTHSYLPLAGGSLTGNLSVTGNITATGNVTAYSDIKLKENIELIPNALDKINSISGYTYNRKDIEDETRHTGVIAQEVQKVLPEAVIEDGEGTLSVAYGNMVGLLIEAIKELKSEVDDLKGKFKEEA